MSGVAWRSLADVRDEPASAVLPGDLVRTGGNLHPQYRVIAVTEDRAWIREVQRGTDHVIPIGRCRRLANGEANERSGASDE